MNICVYGASRLSEDKWKAPVYALGERLGQAGYGLVFGGFNQGLMEQIALGFAAAKAQIIGVVPEILVSGREVFSGCTNLIKTKTLAERKLVMAQQANAFLALPGGLGTLDEISEIMARVLVGELVRPALFFNIYNYWTPFFACMQDMYDKGFFYDKITRFATLCSNSDEVLASLS